MENEITIRQEYNQGSSYTIIESTKVKIYFRDGKFKSIDTNLFHGSHTSKGRLDQLIIKDYKYYLNSIWKKIKTTKTT
jgi:hypothetical protein